jgi:hypothetical protein
MTPKSPLRNAQQNRLECATWNRIDNETPTIQGGHNCATFPLCSTTGVWLPSAALLGFNLLQPVAGPREPARLLQSVTNGLRKVTTKNIP